MSNVGLIIEERAADLGNFLVGRLLPFRQKRAVGPFVFIDHMGPTQLKEFQNLDVGPHPHIGLSTLTYLFEGAIQHKDSLGNDLEIKPGAVNWMTAGKGVVHSERTPAYLRDSEKSLHGLQIWVALPKELQEIEPNFTHIEQDKIPHWQDEGVSYKLIAGKYNGFESPVPVYSPLYFIEIKTNIATKINLGDGLFGESALYILEGEITEGTNSYGPKQLLIAKDATLCEMNLKEGTTIYIFGGEAFPEEHFIYWNFVHTSKDRIEEAKQAWINHQFPIVPNDNDYVPMPDYSKK